MLFPSARLNIRFRPYKFENLYLIFDKQKIYAFHAMFGVAAGSNKFLAHVFFRFLVPRRRRQAVGVRHQKSGSSRKVKKRRPQVTASRR